MTTRPVKPILLSLILLLLIASSCAPVRIEDPAVFAAHRAIALRDRSTGSYSSDSLVLYYHRWPAEGTACASLLVLHGIGFEGAPYHVVAEALNPLGVTVYALDLRGHGLSEGERGRLAPAPVMAGDVTRMIDVMHERDAGQPVFLLGESLGSIPALAAAARPELPIAGLILVAPALEPHPAQWFGPQLAITGALAAVQPRTAFVPLTGRSLDLSTRDTAFAALRRADPLAQSHVTASYMTRYITDAARWRKEYRPRLRTPLLVLQGGRDNVVRAAAARELARTAPVSDTSFLFYPEARHTLFWDDETPSVLGAIGAWIRERTR